MGLQREHGRRGLELGLSPARWTRSVDIPAMAGWLYTEHHDVINEWNGYWRFDRSKKETGVGDLVSGMSLRDFHSPYYIAVGRELGTIARARGRRVQVPLYASLLAGDRPVGRHARAALGALRLERRSVSAQLCDVVTSARLSAVSVGGTARRSA